MGTKESLAELDDVKDRTFDYIICGGGTAGLTLAARLSEDSNVSVLVLDAGHANLDDPNILVPAQYLRQIFDDRYDWKFWTTPQKHAKDRSFLWPRGKSLGGSSAMNFLAYIRPPAEDINAWEELGNPGWNWDNHLKYMKRGQRMTPPTPEQQARFKQSCALEHHGSEGPLQVGYPSLVMDGEVPFQETLNNMGIQTLEDAMGGENNGTWMAANTIDPIAKTRSYAATAFYVPFKDRPNLTVLTEVSVDRIVFGPQAMDGDELRTAEGVVFSYNDETHAVHAQREVIISAGAIKSPQILELSGIGDPQILGKLGIECVVPLPGVGENVQEHISFACSFELDPTRKDGWNTLDKMRDPFVAGAEMQAFMEHRRGLYTIGLSSFAFFPLQKASAQAEQLISSLSDQLESDYESGRITAALWERYDLQLKALRSETSVDLELLVMPHFATVSSKPEPGKEYMTIFVTHNHPFSRGSIHIGSTIPQQQPICDPHYLERDFDMQILVEGLKFVRKLEETEPFKSMIVAEVDPGPAVQTDEQMRDYIINELTTTFHTAGSCSMLPREKGGVVDPELKVYGTSNVRVVDLSIVPLHIASHPQASVYGIAEQAADIIRGKL